MASGSTQKKFVVKYKDKSGKIRTKHCGNSDSVRECISWLRRDGLELVSREATTPTAKKTTSRRQKYTCRVRQ